MLSDVCQFPIKPQRFFIFNLICITQPVTTTQLSYFILLLAEIPVGRLNSLPKIQ